jgi:hypothetical protein
LSRHSEGLKRSDNRRESRNLDFYNRGFMVQLWVQSCPITIVSNRQAYAVVCCETSRCTKAAFCGVPKRGKRKG